MSKLLSASLALVFLTAHSSAFAKDNKEQLEQKNESLNELSQEYFKLKESYHTLEAKYAKLEQETQDLRERNRIYRNPLSLTGVRDWKTVQKLQGAAIYAQNKQHTYLGVLDFYGKHPDSIFNPKSQYASAQSPVSIWNRRGYFGSEQSAYSPFSQRNSYPPVLKKNKKVIGQLTQIPPMPKAKTVSINPTWLLQIQPLVKRYHK